jgi:2-polyprenyl-3-methyl-5-hydroxy-6-metoxy-1,4-benzoquinol methylase
MNKYIDIKIRINYYRKQYWRKNMNEIDILDTYYNVRDEDSRLNSKYGQIEYLTTMYYLEKYLSPGMKILDIGAGTGKYSHELARKGYEVNAVELIQHNIDIFNKNTMENENIKIIKGNAMDLSFLENNTFDITLVLGPMYHLFTIYEQKKAISEALSVTKNGGIIFFAYCMMDASIVNYGFRNGNIIKLIEKGLIDIDTFKAFSTPTEVFQLYRKEDIDYLVSNLKVFRLHYVATDLFTNYFRETIDAMDEQTYEMYIKYHIKMCERSDIVGITHHSLDILRKYEEEKY